MPRPLTIVLVLSLSITLTACGKSLDTGLVVAFGQTAGRIISELMAGESSEITSLFVVHRKIPYAGPSGLRVLPMRLYKWYLERTSGKTVK